MFGIFVVHDRSNHKTRCCMLCANGIEVVQWIYI